MKRELALSINKKKSPSVMLAQTEDDLNSGELALSITTTLR